MLLLNHLRIVALCVESPVSLNLKLPLEGLSRGILPLCHFDELTDRLEVRLGDKVAVRVLVYEPIELRMHLYGRVHDL